MSRTWWGHYIIVDKGEEYIRFKDYLELSNRIDKAIEYIDKTDFLEKGYICFMYELEEILKGDNNE